MLNTKPIGISVFLLTICLGANGNCSAQSNQSASTEVPNWLDKPVPMHVHPDTASSADREARDSSFAPLFPAPSHGLHSPGPSGTATVANTPEILQIPGGLWVVGTFVNYDVYEISTGGIYTEIHFRLDRIIGPTGGATPNSGTIIDIDIPGGTVLTPSGAVHHKVGWKAMYDNAPSPNHRYLMQLLHVSEGNFYRPAGYWDVTTGVVTPTLPKDVVLARDGKSRLAGMSEADVVAYIQSLLERY
jgi:hypothetical protein